MYFWQVVSDPFLSSLLNRSLNPIHPLILNPLYFDTLYQYSCEFFETEYFRLSNEGELRAYLEVPSLVVLASVQVTKCLSFRPKKGQNAVSPMFHHIRCNLYMFIIRAVHIFEPVYPMRSVNFYYHKKSSIEFTEK